MIKLARNGYTDEEIKSVLHGKQGSRSVSFRYELLDKNNIFKTHLYNVLEGSSIDYGVFNEIKRTAKFSIQEQAGVDIDYMSDRIRPYFVLDMPPIVKMAKKKFRYIRDWANGSNSNTSSHWVEIEVYDKDGKNVALNKEVTSSHAPTAGRPLSRVTDGDLNRSNYTQLTATSGTACWVQVDLGESLEFEKITVWHFWDISTPVPRRYKETKTEVSEDGINWITIYDSAVSGEYDETPEGQTFEVDIQERISKPKSKIEFPLGIFMLASPVRDRNDQGVIRNVDAYDLSLILHDDYVDDHYTVPKGTNYKKAIIDVLQSAGITEYNIEDTDKVAGRDLQFEIGTPKIKIINSLCDNINFIPIIVDINGVFTTYSYVLPQNRPVDYTYEDNDLSVIMRGVSEELDTFSIPNRWVVVRTNSEEEPLRSVFTNDNPNSPTSTVNRGRVIVDYRELEDIADQAALDRHTRMVADNSSQIFGKVKFNSAIMPMHDYHDLIEFKFSKLGVSEKFTETAWTLPLQAGGSMSHEIRRIIQL